MATERQRLNIDFSSLFPGDTINIGSATVDIRPLGVSKLASIARKLKGLGSTLSEEGINLDNYSAPDNIVKLSVLILEQFPEVLEEASNIAIEDLQQLPLDVVVQILDKVMEVNMQSKESLEKNFKSLVGKFNLTPSQKTQISASKTKLPKQSKN